MNYDIVKNDLNIHMWAKAHNYVIAFILEFDITLGLTWRTVENNYEELIAR